MSWIRCGNNDGPKEIVLGTLQVSAVSSESPRGYSYLYAIPVEKFKKIKFTTVNSYQSVSNFSWNLYDGINNQGTRIESGSFLNSEKIIDISNITSGYISIDLYINRRQSDGVLAGLSNLTLTK